MTYASVSTMRPPATPSSRFRTSILPMRKRASSAVSTGISARSSTRGRAAFAATLSHSLDPTRARGSGFERVGKVLGLAGNLAIHELHDAHRKGRPAVISKDEFRNPEVARADDSAHREALCIRLRDARGLDVAPAPDALARLRVLEHCVLPVYVVLDIEVVGVRGGPVAIERLSNLILVHPPSPPVPDPRGPAAPRHRTLTADASPKSATVYSIPICLPKYTRPPRRREQSLAENQNIVYGRLMGTLDRNTLSLVCSGRRGVFNMLAAAYRPRKGQKEYSAA